MAIRNIEFSVSADGISPAGAVAGGLQGEHNATKIVFKLDNGLKNTIFEGYPNAVFRFDAYDGSGAVFSTFPSPLFADGDVVAIEFLLENRLTRAGGTASVYLVISESNSSETALDLMNFPALISLADVPEDAPFSGENYDSISTIGEVAAASAQLAQSAAERAEGAMEITVAAETALKNGAEFVFLGGDAQSAVDIDLSIDEELLTASSNPVAGGVVARAVNQLCEGIDSANTMISDLSLETAVHQEQIQTLSERTYIVECGTNGIWTYEKWSDGTLKCHGTQTVQSSFEESWGGMYRSGIIPAVNYPFEFETRPTETVCLHSGNSNGTGGVSTLLMTEPGTNSTLQTAKYRGIRPSSSVDVYNLSLDYSVKGKIKEENNGG